jgi:ATP-dependent DNA ligase
VALPIEFGLAPQLARPAKQLPEGDWAYEPKWDGFRALAFVDGEELRVQSRGGKPLERYFPELRFPPGRYVLDGELVIPGGDGGQQFETLQQRIHPAASRIARLASETPARYVAFDLLAIEDESWLERPYEQRREGLERLVEQLRNQDRKTSVELTPVVRQPADAKAWLLHGEGVVAKQLGAAYQPGKRVGMVKVKRLRTIDCVVVGWRPGKEPDTVGSLILGLYDEEGTLRVVGHSSGLSAKRKRELVADLAPHETGERGSADPSRWAGDRELEWIALRPELVVEVTFDHVSDGRIRHGTRIVRWRDDKAPHDCRIEQLGA